MALNILSTGVMVRLGKVYGNRMVDVAASNSKLVDRSMRILRDLLGLDRDASQALLGSAGGSVKRALVMGSCQLDAAEADALLKAQRSWIAFRDGHCETEGFKYRGGSIEPLIVHSCRATLTRQRTQQLNSLLEE